MFTVQLWLGNVLSVVAEIGWSALLPIFVMVIVFLVKKKFKILRRFMVSMFLIYVGVFGLAKVFAGGTYTAAQLTGQYIPWASQVLENDGGTGGFPIDEEWEYVVIRLTKEQSIDFVRSFGSNRSWLKETVVPNSLLGDPLLSPLTSIEYPFPRRSTVGFVCSREGFVKRQSGDTWKKTVVSYFDIKTQILFVYYDYGQAI